MQQLSGLATQRGASVTSIILIIMVLGVAAKLAVAIVPAQIGDYQLSKTLSAELKKSNENKETSNQFIQRVNRQLSINADYDTRADEVIVFTNKKIGELAIRKDYDITNNFFANVDIINRFEGDIGETTLE
ncbi:DUF4845 domain-containing protein [Psychrobacter sp.]|uniref:DUF4845 domain-containing protein n=1 Tax=Psychrobacter sp. TaxID=56811 RepID=UPI002648E5BF|nr:DUF4845 domain-containing protein [Psychrobacter sp.]MDN6275054.1 DUF4845 domain-containing protein [Psychrobacter sp.]MDN6308797.1 DUF4845 domain-containing protein [Psychrobacter sp.]